MPHLKKLSLALLVCSSIAAIPDLIYVSQGYVTSLLPYKLLAVLGCFVWWFAVIGGFSRKTHEAMHRVELHMFPNAVAIQGGQRIPYHFSGHGRFVMDAAQLERALHVAANTLDGAGARFFSLKRSALIRIYPGDIGITNVELDAVYQAACPVFQGLEIMVEDEDFRGLAHATQAA